MRRIALAALALASTRVPASGMMDTYGRVATSSSIPCAGTLSEAYDGGAVGGNVSGALTLTCRTGTKVAWVLLASASCGSGRDGMPASFCESPAARPVDEFVRVKAPGETREYRLYRYLFAKDCVTFDVAKRLMRPVTNEVRASFPVVGYACRSASVVDGTRGDDGATLPPAAWTAAKVTTGGPRMATGTDVDSPYVLGVDASDYAYALTWPGP